MTRAAALKLALGVLLIGVSAWLWLRPRAIDTDAANQIAKSVAVRYAAGTGEPVVHFGTARRIAYPDGWEYIWTYRPCPEEAALRVFVPRSGRGARVTQQPDCTAGVRFGDRPSST